MTDEETAAGAEQTPDADLAAARDARERGDLDQALSIWAEIRVRFPEHTAAYLNAARALAETGQFDRADVVLLEGWLRVQAAGPVFASEFARMATRRNDTAEARRRWKGVRRAFPRHPIGWVGGVEMLREAGQVDEAEALLNEVREQFPDEAATPILAASLADVRKDWAASANLWEIARNRLPANPVGYIKGAKALFHLNELDNAERLLTDAIARFPNHAELAFQRAELASVRQNWEEAVERWALVRQCHPANPTGYVKGADALLKVGRVADAETLIVAAMNLFPDRDDLHVHQGRYAEIQLSMARSLVEQDRLDDADALLRRANDKCPDRHDLAMEYAAMASRRHDWPEALRRWRDAQERFPQIKNFAHRVFEAELRMVETAAPASIESLPQQPITPDAGAPDMRAIVTQFESLGGTLHGCEFGLFQRDCAAEPLGLLRWTEMGPDNLIAALEAEFDGVGLPENTELGVHQTQDGPEYFTRDKRFMMSMHTFIKETEISHAKMFGQCCRRLQFLRDKLVSDLRGAAKIFVYKITWRVLSHGELERLHAAIRRYGDATLLYVQREIPGKPHGTVELVKPGLMIGYIDRFSASPTGESLGPATKSWSLICRKALAMFVNGASQADADLLGTDSIEFNNEVPSTLERIA
jgi:tetratricopeptide (TPR) repeat protein